MVYYKNTDVYDAKSSPEFALVFTDIYRRTIRQIYRKKHYRYAK